MRTKRKFLTRMSLNARYSVNIHIAYVGQTKIQKVLLFIWLQVFPTRILLWAQAVLNGSLPSISRTHSSSKYAIIYWSLIPSHIFLSYYNIVCRAVGKLISYNLLLFCQGLKAVSLVITCLQMCWALLLFNFSSEFLILHKRLISETLRGED